jgi:hypothetical protein
MNCGFAAFLNAIEETDSRPYSPMKRALINLTTERAASEEKYNQYH